MSTIERPRTVEGNSGVATSGMPAWTCTASPWHRLGPVLGDLLAFVGVWGVVEGILAISSSKVSTANATFVFSGLNTWGWIVTILGALCLVAAFSLMSGSEIARWFGIAVAGLSAIGQLFFAHANPWWSMAVFAVDMLIIYGLAAYGGARLRQP